MRARLWPRLAWATRTRASAASRVATRRSTSALETKPRADQRLRAVQLLLGEAGVGAGDVDLGARAAAASCAWTERSMTASVWPAPTHWPASTRTLTTLPPSPGTPTGMS